MEHQDIFDIAVTHIANDDYNGIPEATLRERLTAIRNTRIHSRLIESADVFIAEVRDNLSGWDPSDPPYGESNA